MSEWRAIDSDGHITEFHVDWAARLPAELRDRTPRVVAGDQSEPTATGEYSRTNSMLVDGYRFPDPRFEGRGRWATRDVVVRANRVGMSDPRQRLPDMDAEGIDVAVVYGTHVSFYANSTPDVRYAAALCAAWNDMAAEYCRASPERLKFAALVPLGDQRLAVAEAERAVRDLGAVGIVSPPMLGTRSLDQAWFDPLYTALEGLGVPLCVHANPGIGGDTPTLGQHDNWLLTHALSMPMGLMHALASIVCGGVLDRFPTLRVALLEGGVGWVPFFMDRLDEHVEKLPKLVPSLSVEPSEHIKGGRLFFSCEPEEDLAYPVSKLGEDSIMYASDYAHWDCEFPNSVRAIAERDELTAAQKQKILADNAARCYGLPVPARV